MKKQICLHVFNDFKSLLANEIELTIGHYDWSKRLFKGSTFVHLKKIKFQKISLNCFLFKKKKRDSFQKKNFQNFIFQNFFFELHLDLILYERGIQATFSKAQSQSLKKKNFFFFQRLKIKTFFCVNLSQEHLFCTKHIINFLCKHV